MASSNSTSKSKRCSVYVIYTKSGAAKIGIAANVYGRLRELQTGNHEELSVLYRLEVESREIALAVEAALHDRYAGHAIRGEWFTVNAEVLASDMRFFVTFAKLVKRMSVETVDTRTEYNPYEKPKRQRDPRPAKLMGYIELCNVAWDYAQQHSILSIGMIQRKFGIEQGTAQVLIGDFVKLGLIVLTNGSANTYEVIPHPNIVIAGPDLM